MKKHLLIVITFAAAVACNSRHDDAPVNAPQPAPAAQPEVRKPQPKQQPDGTTIEMNEQGVKIQSKSGENRTDVKIGTDTNTHVIIKR